MTIDEIASRLGLSRTTVYSWVCAIPIARKPATAFPPRLGTGAMQDRFRAAREDAYALGIEEFDELDEEPAFRDFVCMYIGEGFRLSRNRASLANPDAAVVLLAARWIRRFARNPISSWLQFHADQDLDEVRAFWAELLEVARAEIRPQRKSNSNRLNGRRWRSRFGVLTVSTDTLLRARLQGWIDCVQRDWSIDSGRSGRGAAW